VDEILSTTNKERRQELPFFSWICNNDLKDACALARLYCVCSQ